MCQRLACLALLWHSMLRSEKARTLPAMQFIRVPLWAHCLLRQFCWTLAMRSVAQPDGSILMA